MAKDLKESVNKCNVFLKMNPFINFRPLKPVEVNYPFELVSLDTAHVTMPSGNKKYIVVAIDHFKQWIEVGILTNETSQSIMNLIEREILMRHRCLLKYRLMAVNYTCLQGLIISLLSSILFMRLQHLATLKVMEQLNNY